MKQILLHIIFAFLLFVVASCSTKQRIVGSWKVDTKGESLNKAYVFHKNGTLEVRESDKNSEINNWEYSSRKKVITISKKNNPQSEHFVLTYLDPLFMALSNNDEGVSMSRQLKIKSLNHKSALRKLKGEWSLIQLEDSSHNNDLNLKFTFWDNGIYQQSIDDETRLGRWILNDDNSKLTLSNDEYTQTIGLNFVKKSKLQIIDNYGSYLMEKTERISNSPGNKKIANRILGAWALSVVGSKLVENSNYTLYLNDDGSLKIFEEQKISQVGKWYVSEDGAFLVLEHSDMQISYPIKDLTYNRLDLIDDFQSISFKRVKL
jgi:hypothetical protein